MKKKFKTYFYKNNFVIFGRRKNIGVAFSANRIAAAMRRRNQIGTTLRIHVISLTLRNNTQLEASNILRNKDGYYHIM